MPLAASFSFGHRPVLTRRYYGFELGTATEYTSQRETAAVARGKNGEQCCPERVLSERGTRPAERLYRCEKLTLTMEMKENNAAKQGAPSPRDDDATTDVPLSLPPRYAGLLVDERCGRALRARSRSTP